MQDKLFAQLLKSIQQGGKIVRGELKPMRAFSAGVVADQTLSRFAGEGGAQRRVRAARVARNTAGKG